ncbi:MAG: DMT family transporter [Clostridium perfringens]|nr:DMT family transporter [Clostridium perfringens]
MDKRLKGIILIIIAAFCSACMGAFIKGASGIPLGEKVFYRNIMLFVVSLIMIAKNKSSLFGHKGNRVALIGRGVFGTLGILAGFYALQHMLLPNETVLSDLNIFFIIIFSFIFLREKVSVIQIIAIVIAFIGILFIVHPGGSVPIIPAIVVIVSAALSGGAYTIIRGLRAKENPETIVFFLALVSLAFTVPSMMFDYVTPDLHQFICLFGAGCAIAGFEVCGTIAYKYAAGKEISIFGYTEVLFAAIISLAVWGELPQEIAYIGYALIIIGGVIVFLYDRFLYKKSLKST